MVEGGIMQLLLQDGDFSALMGDRLYPVQIPEGPTYPAGRYLRVTTNPISTLEEPVSLTKIRIQFDIYAATYKEAKACGETALNAALEGFRGLLPDGTFVDSVTLDSQEDVYDDDAEVYGVSSDFVVWFHRN